MGFTIHSLRLRVRSAWLRFEVEACLRQLSSIAAQRANDCEAERMIHRDLCVLRTELHKLSQNCQEASSGQVPSPQENFLPRLIRFKKRGTETD